MKLVWLVLAAVGVNSSPTGLGTLQPVLQLHSQLVPRDYQAIDGLFQQTDVTTNDTTFDIYEENFGLNPGVTWDSVMGSLRLMNTKSPSIYKLFFLARHGEGFHNIAPGLYNSSEWTCKLQQQNGNDQMEWYDAMLTSEGHQQINELSVFWHQQIKDSAPKPQSFYVSPLRRTLQTFNSTWNNIIDNETVPVIKEFARETFGIGTESKRHSKQYIATNWPRMKFEDGFREEDELWEYDRHETNQHRNFRARLLMNDIFMNDSNDVISITAHKGLIKSILKVVNHRKWNLKTGEVIPVLIKASDLGRMYPPKLDHPWHTLPDTCELQ